MQQGNKESNMDCNLSKNVTGIKTIFDRFQVPTQLCQQAIIAYLMTCAVKQIPLKSGMMSSFLSAYQVALPNKWGHSLSIELKFTCILTWFCFELLTIPTV